MHKASILVSLIVLVAVPCFALAPGAAPVNLAAVLGLSGEIAPQNGLHFLAGGGTGHPLDVTCTATCGTDPSVSCTTTGTCTAVDRNCSASQRGYVNCNGITTYCATPCGCTEGATRTVPTGGCCDEGTVEKEKDRCVGGQWQFDSFLCGPRLCGPFIP